MNYTPDEVLRSGAKECALGVAKPPAHQSIVRRIPITDYKVCNNLLLLRTDALAKPLGIRREAPMIFGTETVTAIDYFRRVIERGDMVDCLMLPAANDFFPIASYWIHIQYVGTPLAAGHYSKKDDGLFAMRAKAGEKAERTTAQILRDEFGHPFPDDMCASPGYFEIRYAEKKNRKPDRRCPACGLLFEIKKRNKDTHLRVSHSNGRPFASENHMSGWHAFVFPDMRPRFVPNAAITQAIADGNFVPGSDRYDTWADVDSLTPSAPPTCIGQVEDDPPMQGARELTGQSSSTPSMHEAS